MKTVLNLPARHLPANRCPREGGVALVIVLGFLVLITVLVVAYFTSVTTESSASRTYASGASAKMLSDAVVNVVMGQIAKGTQGRSATGEQLTWASQPGMIRTFGTSSAGQAGNYAEDCYKLYSSGTMVIPASVAQAGGVLNAMAADIPAAWTTQPALYTDLNAPVADSSGVWNFPIMSGSNLWSLPIASLGGSSALTYDSTHSSNPRATNSPDIEGFYVVSSSTPYQSAVAISATNNPVPMPVQWLYTLRDGTIIAPDAGGNGTTATFSNAADQPSAANPIVGRIAFWTDDESCKLNVNTACEGTYYAFPHTSTATDMQSPGKPAFGYAMAPPATHEYTRYPGHPATTCLSVALGTWLNNALGEITPNAYTASANDSAYLGLVSGTYPNPSDTYTGLSAYTFLSPRYQIGGSLAGTADVSATSSVMLAGTDRLFASPDELIFQPTRIPFPNPSFATKPVMEELKAFLTTSSRAPELTPFNTPKVSLWPQWNQVSYRTAPAPYAGIGYRPTCELLAFCSSFGNTTDLADCPSGKNEYFVQRYITSVDAGWRHGNWDWDLVPRNQMLGIYLSNMGNAQLPGYGASIAAKYSKTAFSSVIIESMDRIRMNDWVDYQSEDGNAAPQEQENNAANIQLNSPLVMSGTGTTSLKLPTDDGQTTLRGFGTWPVCPQFALTFTLDKSGTLADVGLGCQWFYPCQAFPYCYGTMYQITMAPLQNLGLTSTSQITGTGSAIGAGLYVHGDANAGNYGASSASMKTAFGYIYPMQGGTTGTAPLQCVISGSSITFGGGTVTISLWDYNSPSGAQTQAIMQSYNVTFPSATFPAPTGAAPSTLNPQSFLSSGSSCSVRAVECNPTGPLHGDWRLLECLYNTGNNPATFSPSNPSLATNPNAPPLGDYSNQSYTQVHTLRMYAGGSLYNDPTGSYRSSPVCINTSTAATASTGTANVYLAGSLVSSSILRNTDYEDYAAPCVPVGLPGALRADGSAGDWDTGPGLMPDGPYVNPTSQWNVSGTYDYFDQYPSPYGNELSNAAIPEGSDTAVFSPNRMVASPVSFGSLPTGADPGSPQPWQTLLFCPNPAGRSTPAGASQGPAISDHPGFGNPGTSAPDSAYLEFFTMPVVEPYAISEPLSTAGLVNMNYQIAPFTYIERSTALRGVFKNTLLTAIGANDVKDTQTNGTHPTPVDGSASLIYKYNLAAGSAQKFKDELRYDIDRDSTIAGIEEHYFSQGQLFMYPSQICSVFLVPAALSSANYSSADAAALSTLTSYPVTSQNDNSRYDNMMTWWNAMPLTGDNLREEPYDRLYPRLTTKSNTFTVHFRVQTLQKRSISNPAVWTEGQDQVLSEYRGSSLIERYVDPNDPSLNYAWDQNTLALTEPAGESVQAGSSCDLSQLYKFRVISTKKFAP